jgi:SAM-dependent methyltransferase
VQPTTNCPMPTDGINQRYLNGSYLDANPDWHVGDARWKAAQIVKMLETHELSPAAVCEVGCGAGEILRQLSLARPDRGRFVGYEISPDAHLLASTRSAPGLEFRLQDATDDADHYELMLLMDVIEHIPDCVGFLRGLRTKADWTIIHLPLELSLQAIVRRGRLPRSRATLGHLHFFTAELALAAVREAGLEIVDYLYTSGGIERPPQSRLAQLALGPRRLLRHMNEPFAARTIGGFALLILARVKQDIG